MSEQMVTLGEVQAAFDTLLDVVGRKCDYQTTMTVYWAADDVMRILRGEWAEEVEAVADCPVCGGVLQLRGDGFQCESCREYYESAQDVDEVSYGFNRAMEQGKNREV